jgi:hypothetical protein
VAPLGIRRVSELISVIKDDANLRILPEARIAMLRRLRIFGQQDKLRADRSKGRETWA